MSARTCAAAISWNTATRNWIFVTFCPNEVNAVVQWNVHLQLMFIGAFERYASHGSSANSVAAVRLFIKIFDHTTNKERKAKLQSASIDPILSVLVHCQRSISFVLTNFWFRLCVFLNSLFDKIILRVNCMRSKEYVRSLLMCNPEDSKFHVLQWCPYRYCARISGLRRRMM